jgi:hypothetical protein
MKIRLTGTPDEITHTLHALDTAGWTWRTVSNPYPCRGRSIEVRVYAEPLTIPTIPTTEGGVR